LQKSLAGSEAACCRTRPKNPDRSGIYIVEFQGPYATPQDGDRKFYHFRFANGAAGINAGLVRRMMQFSPTRWPLMMANDVNQAASY
jgi:hypothetical protein